jgi:hypothetical protein
MFQRLLKERKMRGREQSLRIKKRKTEMLRWCLGYFLPGNSAPHPTPGLELSYHLGGWEKRLSLYSKQGLVKSRSYSQLTHSVYMLREVLEEF